VTGHAEDLRAEVGFLADALTSWASDVPAEAGAAFCRAARLLTSLAEDNIQLIKTTTAAQAASSADRRRARLLPFAREFDFGEGDATALSGRFDGSDAWSAFHRASGAHAQFVVGDGGSDAALESALAWLRAHGVEVP